MTDSEVGELWRECGRLAKETAYSSSFHIFADRIYKHVDSRIMKYWHDEGGKGNFIPEAKRDELKARVLRDCGIDPVKWKRRGWQQ